MHIRQHGTSPDTVSIFAHYERIRHLLPSCSHMPATSQILRSTADLLDSGECFLLDAFGVLNCGARAIPGAGNFLEALHRRGIPFLVLTNSASIPAQIVGDRLRHLGLNISQDNILSSRALLWELFHPQEQRWGIIAPPQDLESAQVFEHCFNEQAGFDDADGYIFLSTLNWDNYQHARWCANLKQRPRTVWVANPDLSAPRENGQFSREPGLFTLAEHRAAGSQLIPVGKPFGAIFERAVQIARERWNIKRSRIVMVGDTLHTDILGAQAAGIRAVLIESYGFFARHNPEPFIEASGIRPWGRLAAYCATPAPPAAILPF